MNLNFYLKRATAALMLTLLLQLASAQPFVHPGILHNEDDFSRIRTKIASGAEPWSSAYNIFKADAASNKNYVLRGPADSVQRDASLGLRNYTLFIRDAAAAYNTAVMWKITGDSAYAKKSVQIMNAWSYKLKVIYGSDAQLGAGQIGFRWVNAAEIIRSSYPGWVSADIQQFESMLKTVFVPLINMYGDANWGGGCIKAMMGIGIFCNDTTIYNSALNAFSNHPCTSLTKIISPSGQNSESGRDQIHAQINIGHLAEVAWVGNNQGLDLFGALNNRILTGFEYTAKYILGYDVPWDASVRRCTMGPWSTITAVNRSTAELCPMYEMVYNYYVKRKGLNAPYTMMAAANTRIENKGSLNYDGEHLTGWGTLMFSLDEGIKSNNQTITFPAFQKKRFGDADFDPGATASSGLPVIYGSADPSVATIINNKIHFVSAGSVNISAYQVGDANFNPAAKVTQSLSLVFDPYQSFEAEDYNLQANTQTITATDVPPGNGLTAQSSAAYAVYAGAKLGKKGASMLYLRYSTVNDSITTLKFRLDGSTGPAIGSINLKPTGGPQVWKTDSCGLSGPVGVHDIYTYFGGRVNVNWFKFDSLKTFAPLPTPSARLEAEDYAEMSGFSAGADGTIGNIKSGHWESYKNINLNGLTRIDVRAASNSTAGAALSKNVEIHLDALTGPIIGTIVVPKTGNWTTYTTVGIPVSGLSGIHNLYFKFTITGGSYTSFLFNLDWYKLTYNTQNLSFNPLPKKIVTDLDFSPGAVASSGLTVSYTSSNNQVATIVNSMIHLVGNGNTTITAAQAGNAQFTSALSASQQLIVQQPQTITFAEIPVKKIGDPDFEAGASSNSSLPISYASSDPAVAEIVDQRIHINGNGQTMITASQTGDSTFAPAVSIARELFVKKRQSINFPAISAQQLGGPDLEPQAIASSGLPVTYISSDTSIVVIIQNKIHFKTGGIALILATQPGDTTYAAAEPVSQSFKIKQGQNITFTPIAAKLPGDADFDIPATSSANLPLAFTSSNTTVAVITNNQIRIIGPGQSLISAYQPGDSTYTAASSVAQLLTVTPLNLAVNYLNNDNNSSDNNIKPEINIVNNGGIAVSYNELTARYWLTPENYAGLNTWIDYAQIGSTNVVLAYKTALSPKLGALGYLEYSFKNSAGTLTANGQSGPIRSRMANTDWSNFNEEDDYSYINATMASPNTHITLYRNGLLVWGIEPTPATPKIQLSAAIQTVNASATTNTLSHFIKINNDGNIAVNYGDLSLRYWLTADGNANLNYWLDYAKLGNANIKGSFSPVAPALVLADTYLELKFSHTLGQLLPLSNTGNIQQRITKSNWSNFNQTNDYSFLNSAAFALNNKITIYYQGQLVYGNEPMPTSGNGTIMTAAATLISTTETSRDIVRVNRIFPNPVNGMQFNVKTTTDLYNSIVIIKIYDLRTGNVILNKKLQNAEDGILRVELNTVLKAGIYLLQLNSLPQLKLIVENNY